MPVNEIFRKFSTVCSAVLGSSWSFLLAIVVIVVWGLTGPLFDYSDTWQLMINTGTTIVTFLMVFIIQNTQNRDTKAIQLNLDELLKGVQGARSSLVGLEELTDDQINNLHQEFQGLRDKVPKPISDD